MNLNYISPQRAIFSMLLLTFKMERKGVVIEMQCVACDVRHDFLNVLFSELQASDC
jgi:hypothetical protein